jgi:hypothetical protein
MLSILTLSALLLTADPKDEREVKFSLPADAGFPAPKKLVVVKAGTSGPGQPKYKSVAEATEMGKSIKLPDAGPYDIWWVPKHDGMATRILTSESFKDKSLREINLLEYIGGVRIRGDNRARAQLIALTEPNAQGPDDEGYAPLATCTEFKTEMIVPTGFYALWFRGGNAAKATKVDNRLKVLAGKVIDVD